MTCDAHLKRDVRSALHGSVYTWHLSTKLTIIQRTIPAITLGCIPHGHSRAGQEEEEEEEEECDDASYNAKAVEERVISPLKPFSR